MGNTHHKKKVAHCSKPRPLWNFGRSRPDKQRKDTSKSDDETNWTLHFRPSLYQHRQENVFQPASRPAHIEDLHKEAEFGLRSLQEQVSGSLDGSSELQLGNGQDSMDDCSQISQDEDLPDLPDSASGPGDEIWTKTRSLPPPTPDETRRKTLVIQPAVSSTGATCKPQKTQSSFKGPKLKEKRIRRTTIMGLPQHIQQELGLGKGPRPSKADGTDHTGPTLVSRGDVNHCFNNLSHSRVRSSLRSVTFSDPTRQDNESKSTLGLNYLHNWTPMDSSDRPKSLAVPKSSVPSELLQSPVMSMSPQATYLSKIIPNAILPPTVDVVMISNSQNSLCRLSNSGVLYVPSPACSRSVSLQNYDGRDCASSDAWSNSQSSETIVSNNSTISSQGNTRTALNNHSTETDGEKVRVDRNLTDTPLDHRANTSQWVSACTAQLNTNCKPTELHSNGYANQSLSPAHSTYSVTDMSDTQSITSERSITRSLSVRKMKKPPAPPRRMNSLQHGEEQDPEPRAQAPALPRDVGQTSSSRFESSVETSAGGNNENPALSQRLVPTHNEKFLPPQDTSSASPSELTTSPSSGSPTPVKVLVPPPSGRSSSFSAPARSSAPSPSSGSKYAHLFIIPPPPSTPAPPPPNVKPFKVPAAVTYPWALEAIPPPPPGPAPLPPTKRPSFLFNIPAFGTSHPCSPQVPVHARTTSLVTEPVCITPSVTASAHTTTSLAIISTPTTTPLVTSSTSAMTALGTSSAPTSTSLVSASEPTAAPLVTTSASTVTPLVNASEPTTTPLVTTPAHTVTSLVSTSAPSTTPLVNASEATRALSVTTSEPSTTPLVTVSEAMTTPTTISAPTLTPLVSTSEPTVIPLATTSGAPIVTGSLAPGLLASASGPSAAPTTSVCSSVSSSTTEQVQIGVIPLKVKQLSPPPSPPPSHNPPPPPTKADTEQPVPSPSTKLEHPPTDWPPPPPPLSPGEMLPVTEGAAAEFLFPPPPPSLLEDAAEKNRSPEDEHCADVSAPMGLSPPPPPPLPAGTVTSSPKPLTPTPSSAIKQLQPKTQTVEGTASRFPNTGLQPSAPSQNSAKGQVTSPLSQASPDEQTGAPIVTPSLLQMVRLRSVQMNASAVGVPDSSPQMNPSQNDAKQPNKSNMIAPSKPARKSLSQRLSSSTDSEPTLSTSIPLPGTPPHSTTGTSAQGHALLKPGDNETPLKSPASTASFIFSKNVSPKKLVFETPRSPEAQAEAKRNFMAELTSVSGRIASKTESSSSSGPTAKAVPEAQKKAGRVPPPVAKKPSFLSGPQRLPSTSTKVTDAQETSQTLQVTCDVQEEKDEVKTSNGEASLCKGD